MTGRIGITCTPKNNGGSNKDLYFKSVSVYEATDNYVRIKYLLNIDDNNIVMTIPESKPETNESTSISVEINGELYSNIMADTLNNIVTINNLNSGATYNVNLIASCGNHVARSKNIKITTLNQSHGGDSNAGGGLGEK